MFLTARIHILSTIFIDFTKTNTAQSVLANTLLIYTPADTYIIELLLREGDWLLIFFWTSVILDSLLNIVTDICILLAFLTNHYLTFFTNPPIIIGSHLIIALEAVNKYVAYFHWLILPQIILCLWASILLWADINNLFKEKVL
jgi:hypothetical protein